MTGINFNFGADPLLGSRDFSSQMSTIEQMQAELEQKKAAILQARQQMEQQQQKAMRAVQQMAKYTTSEFVS